MEFVKCKCFKQNFNYADFIVDNLLYVRYLQFSCVFRLSKK